MSDEEILTKAIQKAIDGGWSGCSVTHSTTEKWTITSMDRLCVYFMTGGNVYFHPNEFIFNHDFAKALFGNKKLPYKKYEPDYFNIGQYKVLENTVKKTEAWKYHLQQMVIADDPIAYLGQNI